MNFNYTAMMNNAGFNIMQNSQALFNMTKSNGVNPNRSIFKKETSLQISNLQNQTIFKAAQLMEESQKKINHDKIKRSYSIFNHTSK